MIQPKKLIKGPKYQIPNCPNIFTFGGCYANNRKCFTRQDGLRFMGREFIEFSDGKAYLNLQPMAEVAESSKE